MVKLIDPQMRQIPIDFRFVFFLIPEKRHITPIISTIIAKQTNIKAPILLVNSSISYIVFKFTPIFTTTHHEAVIKDPVEFFKPRI